MNEIVEYESNDLAPKNDFVQHTRTQEARAIAEVKAALTIAQAAPRNQVGARERVLKACQRHRVAANAIYRYPRGGTDVTGPTIRLAEVIALNWGNITFGWSEIASDGGESLVEAFAWDLETNVRRTTQFKVPHSRFTSRKNGKPTITPLVDPRDIYEIVANNASRRVRACLFAVLPPDIVEEAVHVCNKTLNAQFDGNKKDCIGALIEDFGELGVTLQQVETYLGRTAMSMSAGQYLNMQSMITAIKEGMATADYWFKTAEPAASDPKALDGGMGTLNEKQKADKATEKAAAAENEEKAAEPEPEKTQNKAHTAENDQPEAKAPAEAAAPAGAPAPAENEADNWDALLAHEKTIIDTCKGDAELKTARGELYDRAMKARAGGADIPLPQEHPRMFLWYLAKGGPIAAIEGAWENLVGTDAYRALPSADKSVLASKKNAACTPK